MLKMIQKAALLLKPRSCHIFFSTQEHSKEITKLTETWFGTEYGIESKLSYNENSNLYSALII